MGRPFPILRRSAAALAVLAATSCSAAPDPAVPGGSSTPAASAAGPLTAQISQFRDNYSKQIIEIQLTNTTDAAVSVLAAGLRSPLFTSGITWTPSPAGTEVPPGQTKSLPARLPAGSCPSQGQPEPSPVAAAVVEVRVAAAAGLPGRTVQVPAVDPFGVLARNNNELCLAQAAAAVAGFRFSPGLEVSADGRTAVLRLIVSPRNPAGPSSGDAGTLTVDSIGGTTLLEEDASAPWPARLRVDAAGQVRELRLGIRPARCDPHAVAEDKVGTLIPLRITVAGREGVLKVDAGAQLRGRIHDFVTSACGRQ